MISKEDLQRLSEIEQARDLFEHGTAQALQAMTTLVVWDSRHRGEHEGTISEIHALRESVTTRCNVEISNLLKGVSRG